jgi:hypothetical protein
MKTTTLVGRAAPQTSGILSRDSRSISPRLKNNFQALIRKMAEDSTLARTRDQM